MTYDASVTVPDWATCVMSALSKGSKAIPSEGDITYTFEQPVPIPSYLFALAIGELSSKDISKRCRVWSEPSMVESVAYEFGQVEEFVKVAEELTLPYQWERYDILCLPPSFPYGGMECVYSLSGVNVCVPHFVSCANNILSNLLSEIRVLLL